MRLRLPSLPQTLLSASLAISLTVASSLAVAQEGEPPNDPGDYSESYSGLFWGFAAVAGPTLIANGSFEDTTGLAYGARFRTSFVLQLLDLHLTYLHAESTPLNEDTKYNIASNAVSLSFAIHPFFLLMFTAPPTNYLFGSMYFMGGASFEFTDYSWQGEQLEESGEIGWHLGLGTDYPVTDPNRGHGLWFGVQWRVTFIPTELPLLDSIHEDVLRQHLFSASLSYRFNGLPL